LHSDVLVPDIAGWRRERMPTLPKSSAFELAPDWVLRLDGAGYRLVGAWRAEAVVQCEPFEALPIRLADLWSA